MRLPERILFVGAHCDDIELFAGGLLSRAAFSRRRIGVLVFSDHHGVISPAAAAQAGAELAENIAWLSGQRGAAVQHHPFDFLPACQGAFERERRRIYAALEALRADYDLVVTHASTDTNQDHQQVATEAQRVFKAHATLLGGEFPNNDLGAFTPSVYIGLSEPEVDAKVRLVSRYESQAFGGRPYLDESVIRSLARVRGSQIRQAAAEAYEVLGRVVVPPDADAPGAVPS
jgi:LmbE family N-acetylglucosaminyl deacetylase